MKVLKIQKKWKEYRMKIKYFKILMHKLWNKYFQIFAMSFAEKNFENMDQALFILKFNFLKNIHFH